MQHTSSTLPSHVELAATPFFSQEDYQCGPAALATVLAVAGVTVTPDSLVSEVFVPLRQGSFQPELLAATRRHGRVAYVIRPSLDAALREVAGGNPVLVLQNLGFAVLPKWHYAVIVGFSLDTGEIVLRSGREERHVVTIETFERTWARADYWGFVVSTLSHIPASAEEGAYVRSISDLEHAGHPMEASIAYQSAIQRWPQSLYARFGWANSMLSADDPIGARDIYRELLALHPDFAPAWNNLAVALARTRAWDAAEDAARRALGIGGSGADEYQRTYDAVRARVAP